MPDAETETSLEFSYPVDVTTIGAKGRHFDLRASREENRALAGRYEVLTIEKLVAECDIFPAKKGQFTLKATFTANVTQSCGVSLEPVTERVSGSFQVALQKPVKEKPAAQAEENLEIDFDPEAEDVEYLKSNLVDLGELIAQYLSLEITPYPRKKTATGEELGQKIIKEGDEISGAEKQNPFAVLKSLKHKA